MSHRSVVLVPNIDGVANVPKLDSNLLGCRLQHDLLADVWGGGNGRVKRLALGDGLGEHGRESGLLGYLGESLHCSLLAGGVPG
jgi:hypothetical protein